MTHDVNLSTVRAGGGIIVDERKRTIADCHTVDLPLPLASKVADDIAMRCRVHDELVEALRPFSALLQDHNNDPKRPDHQPIYAINGATITLGHLRRAAELLAKLPEGR